MRSTRTLAALLMTATAAACSDAVSPSGDITLPPAFAHAGGGAVVTPNEEFTVPIDNTIFVPCADEDVRFQGEMSFRLHETTTPSGISVLHVTIPGSEPGTSIQATGQSSGTQWMLQRGASSQTIVRRDGAPMVVNVTRNETYVAENGSILRLHHNLHMTAAGGGPPTVQDEQWTCR